MTPWSAKFFMDMKCGDPPVLLLIDRCKGWVVEMHFNFEGGVFKTYDKKRRRRRFFRKIVFVKKKERTKNNGQKSVKEKEKNVRTREVIDAIRSDEVLKKMRIFTFLFSLLFFVMQNPMW